MNGIPLPLITEAAAEQQISQIVDHLNALAQETERMFTSIDFKNLNADLANRINSSLTEHQSLEEYASSAKLEKVREELEDSIAKHREAIANGYVNLATLNSQLITLGDLHNKTITPIALDGFSFVDYYVLLASSLLIYIVARFGGKAVITRFEGASLVACYVAYTTWLVMNA